MTKNRGKEKYLHVNKSIDYSSCVFVLSIKGKIKVKNEKLSSFVESINLKQR